MRNCPLVFVALIENRWTDYANFYFLFNNFPNKVFMERKIVKSEKCYQKKHYKNRFLETWSF